MLSDVALHRQNALLKQRNMLVIVTVSLIVVVLLQTMALLTRDREVILQPILGKPMTITSGQVDGDYLEAVTRDTALVLLNRSPDNLSYWQENVLRVSDEASRGEVKRALVKIVDEMRNSDLTQAFAMSAMRVNPKELWSEVDGVVTTGVGAAATRSVAALPSSRQPATPCRGRVRTRGRTFSPSSRTTSCRTTIRR